jgi:phage terminase large subunit-like protein
VFTEVADIIANEPQLNRYLAARQGIAWTNGREAITLKDGSSYRILAPNEQAVRGYDRVGLVLFDEIRTQQTMAVWSAVQYTQRAHPNPTRWAISNAGDPDSVVLNGLRDRGRAAAADPGSDPAMCWLEWSAPDDAPTDDPTQWPLANPALGLTLRGTTLLDELRSDTEEGFRTEALCQWVDTTTAQAIPWDMWERCAADITPLTPADDLRTWWAIDLDTERRVASLVITAEVDDRLVAGVHRQWTAEEVDEAAIADEVEALWADWSPQGIAYDPHTCQGLVDRKPGLPWEKVTGTDWVIACSQLLDAVQTGYLAHANQPDLNSQLAVAGRRDSGDGSWRISRKDSTHPIPAVVALARAVHLSTQAGGVAITVL